MANEAWYVVDESQTAVSGPHLTQIRAEAARQDLYIEDIQEHGTIVRQLTFWVEVTD